MPRLSAFFSAPYEVEVREESNPDLLPDQVMVKTLCSSISPGTERLLYRGQFPDDLPLDENIAALAGSFQYPLKYGYAAVGRVTDVGADVDRDWMERLIFAFQPHSSHFCAHPGELIRLPADIPPERGVFLPSMETAVNLVMDGRPLIGEAALVSGQGIIGLFTTALLARFPLGALITLDCYPLRQDASRKLGAHLCLDPHAPQSTDILAEQLPTGADLAFELSGAPEALDQAIALTGFDGRVVVGSWYGSKRASLNLGGRYHRSRIRLISSQVSTIAPELRGRWTKERRFAVAWEMLRAVQPEHLITQRIPLGEAPRAYQLLDQSPGETIQIILTY